jgi:ATP-dependent Zn protease
MQINIVYSEQVDDLIRRNKERIIREQREKGIIKQDNESFCDFTMRIIKERIIREQRERGIIKQDNESFCDFTMRITKRQQ